MPEEAAVNLSWEVPWALALLPFVWLAAFYAQRSSRRNLSPFRRSAVRILRPLILLLLVLALAGLTIERPEDRLTVIFAVDGSRSVGGTGHAETVRWLAAAADKIPAEDQAGVVVFGRDAMIDTFPTDGFRVGEVLARPDGNATDLGAAVRLARGLLPPQHEGRLVLLSDGVETQGSLEQTLAALPETIDVLWAPIASPATTEVLVEQVSVPERVVAGQPHRVRVVVRASREVDATLRLFRGAVPVAAAPIRLEPGRSQVFAFDQIAPAGAGALLYRAQVETTADATPENNRAAALVQVAGRPSILVIDREPEALRSFARALESSGMRAETGGPGALPADARGLAAYDALVLSDVSASHFSAPQLEAMATWVEDLGGGLVMLGGPESFGRGGYWKTPVEEVLPLAMEVKDRSYFPSVGLVICIDKSGSMAGFDGVSKIDLAKTAAGEVVRLLEPMDQIGIIAFDGAAKWIVPMTPAGEQDAILGQLGTLRAGGGTDAYPAMDQAFDALLEAETRVKHVIVLTDGQLASRDHETLASSMFASGLTVSTVGVGTDADLYTLERIATAGGGLSYFSEDMNDLPRIFLRDAFRVARSWLVEETFQPVRKGFHPLLSGVDSLPALDGYVAASEKASAQHLLSTHRGDPLLSIWRVGLGKSVAFTSDVKARWAGRWVGWEGYGPFWASLVRWAVRDPAEGRLRANAQAADGRLRLAADLLDDRGAFVNGARLMARVVGPDGEAMEVPMVQDGPGRYVGEVEAAQEGPYLAAVLRHEEATSGEGGEAALVSAVVPYADEFRGLSSAPDALERLVASGRVRKLTEPEQLFEHRGLGGRLAKPLAPFLLALAAFLLVLEVAVRKLAMPQWLEHRLTGQGAKAPGALHEDPRLQSLRAARQRATRHVREVGKDGDPNRGIPGATPEASPVERKPLAESTPSKVSSASAEGRGAATSPKDEDDGNYTSRLLRAKRRLRR